MAKKTIKRPYTTDYGTSQGHCVTPRGAVRSAINHLMEHGQKHCTIERPDGPPIDIWWTGHWGVVVTPRKSANVVPFAKRRA